MNIFFIGSAGALSLLPFRSLLRSSHHIVAAGVYKPLVFRQPVFRQQIIALENEPLALAAQQAGIDVLDLSQSPERILPQLEALRVDVLMMACYSKRLPAPLFDYPACGSYNLHPSLLPAYRGPEPVFWQLKHGAQTGVSWHRVSNEFDAGDIVAQKTVRLDDGLSYEEVNTRLAEAGSALVPDLVSQFGNGSLQSVAQKSDAASYYPYPQADDFVLDTAGSARQAFNFMRATQSFSYPYRCRYQGRDYRLAQALDYDNNSSLESAEVQGERLFIPFKQGVLIATVAAKL